MPIITNQADPRTAAPTVPLWRVAPTALAVVDAEGGAEWNASTAELLRPLLGDSELAWRRWLHAAAARLAATGGREATLAVPGDRRRVAVKARPAGPGGRLLLALDGRDDGRRDTADLAGTISTLSHELRTPLAAAKSSLRLVQDGDSGPLTPAQERFLAVTMRNLARLERLVLDLLETSRAEAGELALVRRETDLAPVLRDSVAALEARAREAGLALGADGLPDAFPAHADPDRVAQMITNVLDNALKYTPRGGRVRVWLESDARPASEVAAALAGTVAAATGRRPAFYALVVEDNGPGIPPDEQERVTEPFVRGGTATDVPGAGLGLHITRRLAEAHDGRLRLGGAPGRGTSVWIRLPRTAADAVFARGARRVAAELSVAPDGAAVVVAVPAAGADAEACAARVAAFCAGRCDLLVDRPVDLGAGITAAVVADAGRWREAWAAAGGDGTATWYVPRDVSRDGDGEARPAEWTKTNGIAADP